jgi:hypothetical protein
MAAMTQNRDVPSEVRNLRELEEENASLYLPGSYHGEIAALPLPQKPYRLS